MTYLVASGKGGVGKSTLTCALAASLARKEKRVLVVDADAGLRCQDLLLGVSDAVFYDWADVLCGNCTLTDALLDTPCGAVLLPAPLMAGTYNAEAFAAMIHLLAERFDFVFIDAPAGLGDGLRFLAKAAKCGLVVSGCDAAGMRGACAAADVLREEGVTSVRLLINGVKPALIRKGTLPNLDTVIDRTGVRLIGVLPFDESLADSLAVGAYSPEGHALFAAAANAVALRLTGENVPLTKL